MVKNGRGKMVMRVRTLVIYKGNIAYTCVYAGFHKSDFFLAHAILGFRAYVHF